MVVSQIKKGVLFMDNWTSREWWKDTGERTIATFLGAVIAVLTTAGLVGLTSGAAVTLVVVPTLVSFLKAVLAGSRYSSENEISPASLAKE